MDNSDYKIFEYEVAKLMGKYGIKEFIVIAKQEDDIIQCVCVKDGFLKKLSDSINDLFNFCFQNTIEF